MTTTAIEDQPLIQLYPIPSSLGEELYFEYPSYLAFVSHRVHTPIRHPCLLTMPLVHPLYRTPSTSSQPVDYPSRRHMLCSGWDAGGDSVTQDYLSSKGAMVFTLAPQKAVSSDHPPTFPFLWLHCPLTQFLPLFLPGGNSLFLVQSLGINLFVFPFHDIFLPVFDSQVSPISPFFQLLSQSFNCFLNKLNNSG